MHKSKISLNLAGPMGPGPMGSQRPPMMDGPAGPNQPMGNLPMMQPPTSMMPSQPQQGMMLGPGANPPVISQGFPMAQPTSMMHSQSMTTGGMPEMMTGPITSMYCLRIIIERF